MLRQLLIGVDAMEWDLVMRWAMQGTLPTFRRLIEQGTRGELQTTSAQLPDTVWSSLCAGVNPAKLETFFYVQYERRPDITVPWENSFPWQSIHSSRIGTLRLRRQGARTGSHRAHGFLLTAGPGIPAGRVLSGHSIYDIAPTVLHTAEVPSPPDLDGRPLLLRDAALAS